METVSLFMEIALLPNCLEISIESASVYNNIVIINYGASHGYWKYPGEHFVKYSDCLTTTLDT